MCDPDHAPARARPQDGHCHHRFQSTRCTAPDASRQLLRRVQQSDPSPRVFLAATPGCHVYPPPQPAPTPPRLLADGRSVHFFAFISEIEHRGFVAQTVPMIGDGRFEPQAAPGRRYADPLHELNGGRASYRGPISMMSPRHGASGRSGAATRPGRRGSLSALPGPLMVGRPLVAVVGRQATGLSSTKVPSFDRVHLIVACDHKGEP